MSASEFLDLRGVACPENAARALVKLATMMEGEILEIALDAGEPMENVPSSLEAEGYRILKKESSDGSGRLLVEAQ